MKKNRIRLTESQLHNLIKKSVKSFINEGGHLTWKDDNGRMHTNSQDNWYGIEGATFVSHGEWSDGEIYFDYEGEQYVINANDAEEWLWDDFKEYCEENNLNPDEHSDDEIWYNFARNEGYDVLLNLGPYNESYEMNESKYMNKNKIRLTESDLHKIIKKLVNEALNEIGDSDRIHNYLGTIDGYHQAQGNSDKANRAYNLSNRLQKNRNNGQLYDPNSKESASEYRRNSYAYTSGFSKGWDKGRQQMKEATADPKQRVKVSESQLHGIIKESVKRVLREGKKVNNIPLSDRPQGKGENYHDAIIKQNHRAMAKRGIDDIEFNNHWRGARAKYAKMSKMGLDQDILDFMWEWERNEFCDLPIDELMKKYKYWVKQYDDDDYEYNEPPTYQAMLRSGYDFDHSTM